MIVANIRGGLGNQLFMYAFGRALSLQNSTPLSLDCISGFKNDYFARNYGLQHFDIHAERTERRTAYKVSQLLSKLPLRLRRLWGMRCGLLIEPGKPTNYDATMAGKLKSATHLHTFGYWQNELYFKPFEDVIRRDLQITTAQDAKNMAIAEAIRSSNAVCLHARRLHNISSVPNTKAKPRVKPLPIEYYQECLARISAQHPDAHVFCFADDPAWMQRELQTKLPLTFVIHNQSEGKDYADLWLMSLCRHFVIANSTFSWWGAWLGRKTNQIVLCPHPADFFGCGEPAEGWIVVRH